MPGSEPSIDWYDLAPRIEHQMRERIVEALRRVGPLAVSDLKGVLVGDATCHLAHVSYHLTVLLREEVLTKVGRPPTGAFHEKNLFLLPSVTIAISSAQRDAVCEQLRDQLSGIADVETALLFRDYEGAQRLFSEYGEDLLLLGGLGFGDQRDKPVELTVPPEVLRRALPRLRELAEGQMLGSKPKPVGAAQITERSRLIAEVCEAVLDLDQPVAAVNRPVTLR